MSSAHDSAALKFLDQLRREHALRLGEVSPSAENHADVHTCFAAQPLDRAFHD